MAAGIHQNSFLSTLAITLSALQLNTKSTDCLGSTLEKNGLDDIMTAPVRRRTRIVCISDTHNCQVKLPKGDVLIHAGDLTNQGTHAEVCNSGPDILYSHILGS
jgi:hypothetical protein